MDQQVGYIIGHDGDDLYGIACNNRAYMRRRGLHGAWYGIEKEAWQTAQANNNNIKVNLVTIEEGYSHSHVPPEASKIKGTGTKYGGKYLVTYQK